MFLSLTKSKIYFFVKMRHHSVWMVTWNQPTLAELKNLMIILKEAIILKISFKQNFLEVIDSSRTLSLV